MDNLALLQTIVDRLTGYLPFLDVGLFPNSPQEYRFLHPEGAVLVMYRESSGDMNQRTRSFDLVAVARTMPDACRIIEAVRWIMNRWVPYPGAGRFAAVGDEFMQEDEGVWWYGSRFATTGPPDVVKETDLQAAINQLFNIT